VSLSPVEQNGFRCMLCGSVMKMMTETLVSCRLEIGAAWTTRESSFQEKVASQMGPGAIGTDESARFKSAKCLPRMSRSKPKPQSR
jgi:hypothetical protein